MIRELLPNWDILLHAQVKKCSYNLDRHFLKKTLIDNMHHHNVFTGYVVNGGKMLSTMPDGTTRTMELPNGIAVHRDFETIHQVKNIGESDIHIILVEHKNIEPTSN